MMVRINKIWSLGLAMALGIGSASYADTIDMSQKPFTTPTLEYVAGKEIPNTDPVEYYPNDLKSAYTLTQVDTQSSNTITQYIINETTKYYDPTTGEEIATADKVDGVDYIEAVYKETTPQYYTVNLSITEYGHKDGATDIKYFKYDAENKVFTEGTSDNYDVVYYVDGSRLSSRISSNLNGADVDNDFIGNSSENYGGAIYNYNGSAIGNITGDFIGNTSSSTGGAIYNYSRSTIGDITGDFINNVSSYSIDNGQYSTIGNITSDFIGNSGGGISNSLKSTIGNITGDFIGNSGRAIYNNGDGSAIGNITGDFIGNSGGVIYNGGGSTIGNITGDFIQNSTSGSGGAIYNSGIIGNITGNFIGNVAGSDISQTSYWGFSGAAIYNTATIGDISGSFIDNKIETTSSTSGGAIYNSSKATIGNITGDFIGNQISSVNLKSDAKGGAIYNENSTDDIVGNFISNSVTGYNAQGGAIFNKGSIGNIIGDFIDNSTTGSRNSHGGAIYNTGTILDITGNFINNRANRDGAIWSGGSAIYNTGTIGDIKGVFFMNKGSSVINSSGTIGNIEGSFIDNEGSVISSSGTVGNVSGYFSGNSGYSISSTNVIGNITGDFVNNHATSIYIRGTSGDINANFVNTDSNNINTNINSISLNYGALYNNGVIGSLDSDGNSIGGIKGLFLNNKNTIINQGTAYANVHATGGGITNEGNIGYVIADFINNSIYTEASSVGGGGIANTSYIGSIIGDFTGNSLESKCSSYGGAIYNTGSINIITGNFSENKVIGQGSGAQGGAIYNTGAIGALTGDFIGNYAIADIQNYTYIYGGAIYNNSQIGNITGSFYNNYLIGDTKRLSSGGAIFMDNNAKVNSIVGDFANNYITESTSSASGGALYNKGIIGVITENGDVSGGVFGTFSNNHVTTSGNLSSGSGSFGGAISNGKTIVTFVGDFVNNYVYSENNKSQGGGINTSGKIYNIYSDFIGNYADSIMHYSYGGAVYNSGTIDNIFGDFSNNYANAQKSAKGGAIHNYKDIGTVNGNFQGNYAKSVEHSAEGGAIYNEGNIIAINGSFYNNNSQSSESSANGGAILNRGTIGNITGDFVENSATGSSSAYGGAIYNYNNGIIGDITGDFIGNSVTAGTYYAYGGAIYNYSNSISNITGDFISNGITGTSSAYGGAIYNEGTIGKLDDSGKLIGGIYGSFIDNYAQTDSTSNLALGGAVYTNKDMNFITDNNDVVFSGNYTKDVKRGKLANAIFVATSSSSSPTIKFIAQNNGTLTMNDQVEGGSVSGTTIKYNYQYTLALDGDETGKIAINNDIINANITLDNTNLYLGKENVFDRSNSFTANSGSISFVNQSIGSMHVPTFNLNGNTNIAVDVDLASETMDRLTADTYNVTNGAILSVNHLNLLSDSTSEEDETRILFADPDLANSVMYTGKNPVAYSPIYKYDISYITDEDDLKGYFVFGRSAGSGSFNAFNPAVTPTAVTQQAGAFTTQMQTFNYAFQHSENFMNIPSVDRMVMRNQNRYAMSPTGDATDVGRYSPLFQKDHEHNGFWVKPYASFENVPLKNGPKVSNISYGTLIGYDTELKALKHGWDRVITGYVGYNGASQRYTGVDTYQNGGIAGFTNTLYKGNFFNATTLSVGSSVGSTTSMYGHEDYTMLLGGLGNKMGYNFEFKEGRYILQPSMLLSYTFVNTFDYTNAAGVRIDSDPMHAIQLAPGVKFIMNTKNGWQPYLAVNMVWNILDKQKVMANDVRLPEMSIKPYVEYGMGIQRCFKQDRMTAFGQAMVHSGGRNGVSLTAGLRFKVGKDPNKVKAEKPRKEKQVKAEKVKKETKSQTTKTTKAPIIKLFGLSLVSEK